MSRSDAELSPFIFLLICHKSKQTIYIETESLITLINNDSRRHSVQKQLVLISDLNQVAWIVDLTIEVG